jgi:preprotein translocase subunit YajC
MGEGRWQGAASEQVGEETMLGHDFLTRLVLLADEVPAAPGDGQGGSQLSTMLLFVAGPLLFLWLLVWRPQQKADRARRTAIEAVKPNDHVVTAGGIHGVVTNVHREAGVATIRVDETNNTKLRVSLGSIARVLTDEPPAESPPK